MKKIQDQEKSKFLGELPNLTCKNQHLYRYEPEIDDVVLIDITKGKVTMHPEQKVCYASNKKNAIRKLLGKENINKYIKKK